MHRRAPELSVRHDPTHEPLRNHLLSSRHGLLACLPSFSIRLCASRIASKPRAWRGGVVQSSNGGCKLEGTQEQWSYICSETLERAPADDVSRFGLAPGGCTACPTPWRNRCAPSRRMSVSDIERCVHKRRDRHLRENDPIGLRPCPSEFHLLLRYLTTRRVNREYRRIGAKLSCPRRCTL
jgi:hypothetical protein